MAKRENVLMKDNIPGHKNCPVIQRHYLVTLLPMRISHKDTGNSPVLQLISPLLGGRDIAQTPKCPEVIKLRCT